MAIVGRRVIKTSKAKMIFAIMYTIIMMKINLDVKDILFENVATSYYHVTDDALIEFTNLDDNNENADEHDGSIASSTSQDNTNDDDDDNVSEHEKGQDTKGENTYKSIRGGDTPITMVDHKEHHEGKHKPIYAPPNEKVLGLISPPGIYGGYRNQVMKFLGFITYALSNNIKYILLDSLVSVTVDTTGHNPDYLTFESIYDIDHWNTFHEHLPQLVDYHESSNFTCWKKGDKETEYIIEKNQLSGARYDLIKQGSFSPLLNASRANYAKISPLDIYQLRRSAITFTNIVNERCMNSNPIPYGGGAGGMKLWDVIQTYEKEEKKNGIFPFDAKANLHKALRPKKKWRYLAKSCIGSSDTKYLGIHLRVEMDMLGHKCAKGNEHNISKIFHDIDDFLTKYHDRNDNDNDNNNNNNIEVMAVATSRKDLERKDGKTFHDNKILAEENLITFNNLVDSNQTHNFGGKALSIVECGQRHVDMYLDKNPHEKEYEYGALLPMVVNFEMLVEADIFIGALDSSYSYDVWVSRYHRKGPKDANNYMYTKDGILSVGDEGMPEPFKCW